MKIDSVDKFGLSILVLLLILLGFVLGVNYSSEKDHLGTAANLLVAIGTFLLCYLAYKGFDDYKRHEKYKLTLKFAMDMYTFEPTMSAGRLKNILMFCGGSYLNVILAKRQINEGVLTDDITKQLEVIRNESEKASEYIYEYKKYVTHYKDFSAMALFVSYEIPSTYEYVQELMNKLNSHYDLLTRVLFRLQFLSRPTGWNAMDELDETEKSVVSKTPYNLDKLLGFNSLELYGDVLKSENEIRAALVEWLTG